MTTPTHFYHRARQLIDDLGFGCLPYRVRQREQIVSAGYRHPRVSGQANHLPAPWDAQVFRVLLAQVVGVRLGVCRQRTQHGGAVGVHVGQRRDDGACARAARAQPSSTHGETLPLRVTTIRHCGGHGNCVLA
jgi:hypothetical protein